jgi:peroxiredoxin
MKRILRASLLFCGLLAIGSFVAQPASGAIKITRDGSRKRAPEFELKDVQGKTVHLSDYRGQVVLLDFWATWCVPCKGTIPWLIELSEKYRSAGLTVIGISMDEDGWQVVKPFVEKMHITYPILLGNKRAAYLYGDVESLPLAFFVDRNQHVAAIHVGAGSRSDFEKTVKLLLESGR